MANNKTKSITFEAKLDEVNEILNKMNSGDIPLEEMLESYKKAKKLIQECKQILEEAKKNIDKNV